MMNIDFGLINWLSVVACFVVGQIFLTLWFAVIFGTPWAKAYTPGKTKAEHTKEVPGYTYGIGALCMLLLVLGLEILQNALGINSLAGGIGMALFVGIVFVSATTIPGYAFLKRWNALKLALGSQLVVIIIISSILSIW